MVTNHSLNGMILQVGVCIWEPVLPFSSFLRGFYLAPTVQGWNFPIKEDTHSSGFLAQKHPGSLWAQPHRREDWRLFESRLGDAFVVEGTVTCHGLQLPRCGLHLLLGEFGRWPPSGFWRFAGWNVDDFLELLSHSKTLGPDPLGKPTAPVTVSGILYDFNRVYIVTTSKVWTFGKVVPKGCPWWSCRPEHCFVVV